MGKEKKQEQVDDKDDASSVSSASSYSSMLVGTMNQKRSQDKVPVVSSYMKAKEVGDDEMSELSSLHDRKSDSPVAGAKKKQEQVGEIDDASSVLSVSTSLSMTSGTRKQNISQDKVHVVPSDGKAKFVGDGVASESLSSDYGKSEWPIAGAKKKKQEQVNDKVVP